MPAMAESSFRRAVESCIAVIVRFSGGTKVRVIEPDEPESVVRMRATSGCEASFFSALSRSGVAAASVVPTSVETRTLRRL
jgi:hypothetical protein